MVAIRWWLGDPPRIEIPGAKGFSVYVGNSIQDVIAFLGWRDSKAPGGIRCEGTGFLLHFGGQGYIVTVRHVAEKLGDDPFAVRINKYRREALLLDADHVKWYYPADLTVDLAVTPANFGEPLYFPEDHIFSQEKHGPAGIGDFCYTAGLFRFIAGHKRNLPFLLTGHVALMPPLGEKIPVGTESGGTDHVEAYLIENNAIKGASGSPVFIRPTYRLTGVRREDRDHGIVTVDDQIYLLGVYQAAWFLPPDAVLREGVQARATDVVPVGIGVVVPVHKLVELLNIEDLKEMRAKNPPIETMVPARNVGVSSPLKNAEQRADDEENPQHLEDFRRLVDVAARKRPRGD